MWLICERADKSANYGTENIELTFTWVSKLLSRLL